MKARIWIIILLLLCRGVVPAKANSTVESNVDWPAFMSQHDMIWEELPRQWNEGAFVGNGQLGMMVYATLKDNRIDFHLGRLDVTDHRKAPDRKTSMGAPGAGVMYDYPRLDIGRMALYPKGKILSGTLRQDLWNAEVSGEIVTDLGKLTFRAYTPYNRMVNLIEVHAEGGEAPDGKGFNWTFLPGNPMSPRAQVFPHHQPSKEYVTNPRHELKTIQEMTVCVQPLLAGGDYATAWQQQSAPGGSASTLIIATANEVPRSGVSEKVATDSVLEAAKLSADTLRNEHRAAWHAFYQTSFLCIPDARMESFHWIQLYTMGDFVWAMHNYWLQYRYLGDWKSIGEKWVPKAIKTAEIFEKRLDRRDDGRIGLRPMGSPEYKGFAKYPDTNYNLALFRWLLNSLIEACEKTGQNPPELAKWKETLAALIPYPVDENGLMIGSNQPVDMSHRHYSHLLALYPLFQLNPDSPADRELVDKSVVHWHRIENGKELAGYSFTGAASLYAALGRGDDAYEILQHFLLGKIGISQLLPNTMYVECGGRNPVIETPLSCAASISELLLQSWGNKIRIFPAVPGKWQQCAFQDLMAQGGFKVSASRKNGKTAWVAIESLAGEKCVVKIPDWDRAFQTSKGRKIKIRYLGDGEFALDLKAGEKVALSEDKSTRPIVVPVAHDAKDANLFGVKKGKALSYDQSWPLPEYK